MVSGGSDFPEQAPALQDRLYLNDGRGHLRKAAGALPARCGSAGCGGVLFPRRSLQILWAGATLPGSMGEPPFDTGTISSTSKLIGCPAGSE